MYPEKVGKIYRTFNLNGWLQPGFSTCSHQSSDHSLYSKATPWPLLDMIAGSMVAMNPLWPWYTFTNGHAITIFHGVLMNGPIIDMADNADWIVPPSLMDDVFDRITIHYDGVLLWFALLPVGFRWFLIAMIINHGTMNPTNQLQW